MRTHLRHADGRLQALAWAILCESTVVVQWAVKANIKVERLIKEGWFKASRAIFVGRHTYATPSGNMMLRSPSTVQFGSEFTEDADKGLS